MFYPHYRISCGSPMAQHFDQKIGRRFSRLRRGHWLEWLSGEARATLPFRLSSPVCVAVTGSPGRLRCVLTRRVPELLQPQAFQSRPALPRDRIQLARFELSPGISV
ncbi:hypothetical protein RRG08_037275 [Elysia crispata]|uniref:Uncharacterized protein n=1 Tax=Elysia crispata TaxID=231223 RepID=A0AAE1CNQ1_9GAST|nr:hypothetical protein RRG08_037275 [Elysia crispata]